MPIAPDFTNHYAALPAQFHTKLAPSPVASPTIIAVNDALAGEIGLDAAWLKSDAGQAMLAGNAMPDGADPLAQVYAGHQFGGWSPRLGDGRAHLLGEITGPDKRVWDIQLKGSGPTPYSRMGDGRAWLGPVLREYLVSEAMHALGVPTTRALAAIRSGEPVLREQGPLPGAVLTRAAPSHIRVGTFQYFASQQDEDSLSALLEFAIARHYHDLNTGDALGFLRAVTRRQAELVAQWMGLGFIHGVMNTDNTHIGGITIDYGPCAFMDAYHPAKVFSSIDRFGRYAYQAQPEILVWNLAQLASSLLPLIDPDTDRAIAAAQDVLHEFGRFYSAAWKKVFFAKIGLSDVPDGAANDEIALVQDLLARMTDNQADFTLTFRSLATDPKSARDYFVDPEAFDAWHKEWIARGPDTDMTRANPAIIPRNHQIERVIEAAVAGDDDPFHELAAALARPFEDQPQAQHLAAPPRAQEIVQATFCGT